MCKKYVIQGVISVEKNTVKPAGIFIVISPSQDYTVIHGTVSFGVLVEKTSAVDAARLFSLKEPAKFEISSVLEAIALAAACKQAKVELEVSVEEATATDGKAVEAAPAFIVKTIRFPVK